MTRIITCKVGNSIINCYDKKYDKYKLKEWSNKNLLKCPVCGGIYEYCHGEIASQYFRHKERTKCLSYYYEPETDEHIKGKVVLYEWLKKLESIGSVEKVRLEHYIPETKQRPDLYFEQNSKRYVIEFQCTPIASEYVKRRELYRLADVNDVWILGLEKYQIDGKNKTIEEKGFQLKLDAAECIVYTNGSLLRDSLPYRHMDCDNHNEFQLDDLIFNEKILLCEEKVKPFIAKDAHEYKKWQNKMEKENEKAQKEKLQRKLHKEITSKVEKLFVEVRQYNKDNKNGLDTRFQRSNKKRYACRIEVFSPRLIGKHIYFFFDKDGVSCSKRTILDKRTGYSTFDYNGSCDYRDENLDNIEQFIKLKIDELSKEEFSE